MKIVMKNNINTRAVSRVPSLQFYWQIDHTVSRDLGVRNLVAAMVKEIDGCLAIAYPLTEGIVKTINGIYSFANGSG